MLRGEVRTSPRSIEIAEDRKLFAAMLTKLDIPQPENGLAVNEEEALAASKKVGYPVLVRPSFVLGGRAMQIVYSDSELREYMRYAVEASPERPVLVDKFLEDATEVDVDCICDVGHFDNPDYRNAPRRICNPRPLQWHLLKIYLPKQAVPAKLQRHSACIPAIQNQNRQSASPAHQARSSGEPTQDTLLSWKQLRLPLRSLPAHFLVAVYPTL